MVYHSNSERHVDCCFHQFGGGKRNASGFAGVPAVNEICDPIVYEFIGLMAMKRIGENL